MRVKGGRGREDGIFIIWALLTATITLHAMGRIHGVGPLNWAGLGWSGLEHRPFCTYICCVLSLLSAFPTFTITDRGKDTNYGFLSAFIVVFRPWKKEMDGWMRGQKRGEK